MYCECSHSENAILLREYRDYEKWITTVATSCRQEMKERFIVIYVH